MKMNVRVDGLSEVLASLQQIPADTRTVLSVYVNEWADNVLIGTLLRVPRGKTGQLGESYGSNVRADGLQAAVGSSLWRSRFTELGTRTSRARPHLYPGFLAGNRVFRQRIRSLGTDLGKIRPRVRRYKRPGSRP